MSQTYDINYIYLLDFDGDGISVIQLTNEDKKNLKKYEDTEGFLKTVQEKYDFRLKSCYFMSSERFNEVRYKDGKEIIQDIPFDIEKPIWTEDAIINLQYITMYGEIWGVEASEMRGSWDSRFEKYRKMAIEFSKNEPDWDKSDVDYETAIEAFCKRELGF